MKKSLTSLKQTIVLLVLCTLTIGFQSCDEKAEVVTEFDLTTAQAEIEAANQNFTTLLIAGDSVGLANYYTIDARIMSAGAPSIVGRTNIQTAMASLVQSDITKIDIRIENIYGTADLIAEEGELTFFIGDEAVTVEKYIGLWKKEDGKWKLFRDISNSNSPAK